MKPVAPAWYAQFRAGTGGKRGGVKALSLRAIRMEPRRKAARANQCGGRDRPPTPVRLRTQGDGQWHGRPDPVSVETRSCARTYSQRGIPARVRNGLRTRDAVAMLCAAVACLAWDGRIGDLRGAALAGAAL